MRVLFVIVCSSILGLSGCVKSKVYNAAANANANANANVYFSEDEKTAVKLDRYTIIELDKYSNDYILDQIISISLPKNMVLTVQDGFGYVLNQTGYNLCDNVDVENLYNKQLPIAHYKIGPIRIGVALKKIAGPAWDVFVDDVERTVCFSLKTGYKIKRNEKIGSNNE